MNSDFTTIAAATGPVSFDWSFFSHRLHSPDGFGYLLNGSFTQLADQSSLGSGSSQFNVLAGDVFGFRAYTLDNEVGAGTATISNFSAPFSDPTPVPGPLPLLGAGAAFSCSRRLRRRISLAHGSVSTATQTNDQVWFIPAKRSSPAIGRAFLCMPSPEPAALTSHYIYSDKSKASVPTGVRTACRCRPCLPTSPSSWSTR